MDINDFKYEFDFFKVNSDYELNDSYYPFIGYVCLHQYIRQELFQLSNVDLLHELKNTLDDNETIEENCDLFILHLNYIDESIIEYVKLFLNCYLILYKDFVVNENIISFKRIYDENTIY